MVALQPDCAGLCHVQSLGHMLCKQKIVCGMTGLAGGRRSESCQCLKKFLPLSSTLCVESASFRPACYFTYMTAACR